MRCPQCQTVNPRQNRFCINCAAPLAHSDATPGALTPNFVVPIPGTNYSTSEGVQAPEASAAGAAEGAAYRPSGRCTTLGGLMLLGATVASSLAVGAFYYWVGWVWMDLLIISPVFAGILVAVIMMRVISMVQCRSKALVVVCSMVACVLTYGTKQVLQSQSDKTLALDQIAQQLQQPSSSSRYSPAQLAQLRILLLNENPLQTLVGDLRDRADNGITVTDAALGSAPYNSGFKISGLEYWGLLVLEIGLLGMVVVGVSMKQVSLPFCERCDRWMQRELVLRVHPHQNLLLSELARQRNWQDLAQIERGQPTQKQKTDVFLASCPQCQAATLALESTSLGRNGRLHLHIATPSAVQLRQQIRERFRNR